MNQHIRKRFLGVLPLAALLLGLGACRAFSPSGVMAGYAENFMDSLNRQEDPEMVRQGVPSMILVIDAMLADDPDSPDLLRVASTAYATYAQAFVVPKEENARATILFRRAKEYGMRLLCQRGFFAKVKDAPFEEYEKALPRFDKSDVPDLYATGSAWIGLILSQTDSMAALADLSKALALMERSLELDEAYADGGAHLVFAIYYAVRPPGGGRDMVKSNTHFQRAIQLAGKGDALPKVLYAEYYAVTASDQALFVKTLEGVLAAETPDPSHALRDAIAKEYAKALLKRKDDLF